MLSPALRHLVLFFALSLLSIAESLAAEHPEVTLHTSMGDIRMELYPESAPVTVANFLNYAKSGFYDNTIFHRVIRRFVVQGGGMDSGLNEKPNGEPIINEAKSSGLSNERWTVAMARTDDPNSARSQFFINLRMNLNLDARAGKDGYAVFGKVIDGFNVVSDISTTPTSTQKGFQDVPVKPVLIESISIKMPQTTGN